MVKQLSYFLYFVSFAFYGQTIPVDPTFNEGESGVVGTIYDFAGLPDGKIIIAGHFTHYNDAARQCVARIKADGSLDQTFGAGGAGPSRNDGLTPHIFALKLCPDGKILIGGNFEKYNGQNRKLLVRLNANGTLDTSFNADDVFDSYDPLDNGIHDIELTDDDKIFACGSEGLVKLNSDGSQDISFEAQVSAALDYITQVKVLENGKLIVGGWILETTGFVRLNPDGSVDDSFYDHDGIYGAVNTIHIEENGKILVGGWFNDDAGTIILYRLNEDGSIDETFQTYYQEVVESLPSTGVYCISKYQGKILISGLFDSLGGSGINDVALLNDDGTVDTTFNTGEWATRYIHSLFVQNDTNILVAPHYQEWGEPLDVPGLLRFGDGVMSADSFSESGGVIVLNKDHKMQVISESDVIKNVWFYDVTGRLIDYAYNLNNTFYSFEPQFSGVFFGTIEMHSGKIFDVKTAF